MTPTIRDLEAMSLDDLRAELDVAESEALGAVNRLAWAESEVQRREYLRWGGRPFAERLHVAERIRGFTARACDALDRLEER